MLTVVCVCVCVSDPNTASPWTGSRADVTDRVFITQYEAQFSWPVLSVGGKRIQVYEQGTTKDYCISVKVFDKVPVRYYKVIFPLYTMDIYTDFVF